MPAHPEDDPQAHTTPAAKNIQAIAALEQEALDHRTPLDRLTDAISAVAGSPAFVVGHAVWFAVWITVNLARDKPFDPYPFNLMTLVVSLEAIILTGFVLMTQNRMTKQADKRAHLDLQINLLAEQELTAMLSMLYALCHKAGVKVTVRDAHVQQLLEDTDIQRLAVELDRELGEEAAALRKP